MAPSSGYGPPVGFVVKFTNGLVAYLSSDTAVFGDMKTVIHDFYKANLAVINLGPNPGLFQSGAYAIDDLLKPASVIFTHVNEAATEGGKLEGEHPDGGAHEAGQGARLPRDQRAHHGIRRQRQVRLRLLKAAAGT